MIREVSTAGEDLTAYKGKEFLIGHRKISCLIVLLVVSASISFTKERRQDEWNRDHYNDRLWS
jgi:hypothetical protein